MTERTEEQKLQALAAALADFAETTPNLDNVSHIKFQSPISSKGILWAGKDYTKQFVYQEQGENLFSSENIDLSKDKHYKINNEVVLSSAELGIGVTKSNLREVGRLKGLIVDGGMSINNYLVYDANTDRLGIGTDEPNATLSVVDEGVEIVVGSYDYNKAMIGTFNHADLNLVTDNTPRLTIGADGNIVLGNRNNGEIKVNVLGSLGVDVNSIDTRVKLHINGAIKYNDNVQMKGSEPPSGGSYTPGDIVWNSEPRPGSYVGWVCVKAGNPGMWNAFGEIR